MATVIYFSGVETGDFGEFDVIGAGSSVVTTPVHTGAYSASIGSAAVTTIKVGGFGSQVIHSLRCYFYIPLGTGFNLYPRGAAATMMRMFTDGSGDKIRIIAGTLTPAVTTGTTVVPSDRWNLFEYALDAASGGVLQVWLNGNLEINTTHTGADSLLNVQLQGSFNNCYVDDILMMDDLRKVGVGGCIARQGLAGTPTYNAWTKNGAATSALCWSDTPFATATNCSDNVQNDAQTMLVSTFSNPQAGHGNNTISGNDTINACKVGMVAKTASAGNTTIRRRVGGADTNVTKALTTSDAYSEATIFTDTLANLDAYEIGVSNAQVATLQTVEDMWMMVDFTESLMAQAVF